WAPGVSARLVLPGLPQLLPMRSTTQPGSAFATIRSRRTRSCWGDPRGNLRPFGTEYGGQTGSNRRRLTASWSRRDYVTQIEFDCDTILRISSTDEHEVRCLK